jgi:hypothetical protein
MELRVSENQPPEGDVLPGKLKRVVAEFDYIGGEELLTVQTQRRSPDGQSGEKTSRELTKIELRVCTLVNSGEDVPTQPITEDFRLGESDGEKKEEKQTQPHTEDYFPTLSQSLLVLRAKDRGSFATTKIFHNLLHDVCRRSIGYQRDVGNEATGGFHDVFPDDFSDTPIRPFHEDIREECRDHLQRSVLLKDGCVIYRDEIRYNERSILLGHNGSTLPLDPPHGFITI